MARRETSGERDGRDMAVTLTYHILREKTLAMALDNYIFVLFRFTLNFIDRLMVGTVERNGLQKTHSFFSYFPFLRKRLGSIRGFPVERV